MRSTPKRRLIAAGLGAALAGAVFASAVPGEAAVTTVTIKASADWTFTGETTLTAVQKAIRADAAYSAGYTGKGVGVALIDTGVAPVLGLTSGNVVNGPDLSLESQVPSLLHKDGYGHGTHLAGIIAGRDDTSGTGFRGIAPDVKLTSIKVGMSNGAVDVSQMLAAIDWVVKHRNDDPKNPIKVLNLSYGTDSSLIWSSNPLTAAVRNAFTAGILPVIASGNTGKQVTVPATDVVSLSVGSSDPRGTTSPADDAVSDFTSSQNTTVGILAPGRSIASLRDPGSYADTFYPSARSGDRFFKGSGTSQAAAVVSGAAALFLQKYPKATPWQVRCALRAGATELADSTRITARALNVQNALTVELGSPSVAPSAYTGDGSLQAARGSTAVTFGDNTTLTGENDIFGPFSTAAWAKASKAGTSWNGGSWMGHVWTGTSWGTATSNQANWNGATWSGRAWSGRGWSDVAWAGRAWSGRAWSGTSFSGAAWSGVSWSGASWG